RVSLEGWAGWATLEYDDPMLADDSGFFGFGDLAFYPTDDWRLSIGVTSILGTNRSSWRPSTSSPTCRSRAPVKSARMIPAAGRPRSASRVTSVARTCA